MKNKTIKIKSLPDGKALVTVRSGGKKTMSRRLANIDAAIEFVLPMGNRATALFLNDYPTTLYGWVR